MSFEPGQFLSFKYKNIYIGLGLIDIIGIYPKGDITPIPNNEKTIAGMANLEGRVVPIHNLIELFNIELTDDDEVFIVIAKTYHGEIGLLLPKSFDIFIITQEQIDRALANHDVEKYKNILPVKTEGVTCFILDQKVKYKQGGIKDQIVSMLTQSA